LSTKAQNDTFIPPTVSKPDTEFQLETGLDAAHPSHHTTLQIVFRALTPVSGPPQIQVFVAQAFILAMPDSGGIAYAPPSDSAWLFPGAPHVLSGAGGCVMVCYGAVTCRQSLLVS